MPRCSSGHRGLDGCSLERRRGRKAALAENGRELLHQCAADADPRPRSEIARAPDRGREIAGGEDGAGRAVGTRAMILWMSGTMDASASPLSRKNGETCVPQDLERCGADLRAGSAPALEEAMFQVDPWEKAA